MSELKSMSAPTHMYSEVREIPEAISRLLAQSGDEISAVGAALRAKNPTMIATIARGSSDHAASFLKYAIELTAGVPVVSLPPSVSSIYGAKLKLGTAATISISQSGESPDILAMTEMAHASGAMSIAITNKAQSPLAGAVAHTVDICAGPELSVAATKSFVSSIVAGLAILAEWQGDSALKVALKELPAHAEKALGCDWGALTEVLDREGSFYVLGRGPAFAIADEVALKFKETCGLHAEAYSAAEVMHGPMALAEGGFPVISLSARDAAETVCVAAAERLVANGAQAFLTSDQGNGVTELPFVATGHPLTDALCLVVPFYRFVEAYTLHRGLNPDQPPLLKKVTETR